ncbi:MAG: hypothetical protein LUD39_05775 [Opitutae bacterium]|nr:hypothetical protein [Opitutae bacterium]MCD8299247.1 hypothetical protein [Opitutae bacterium]
MKFEHSFLYWLPACAVAYFWVAAMSVLGNLLAPTGVSLFTAGILVVIPALFMTFGRGLFCVLISGFLVDAALPVPFDRMNALSIWDSSHGAYLFGEISREPPEFFGFVTGWMVFAFLAMRFAKMRFNFSSPVQWLICAEILNTAIFFFWAIAMGMERWADGSYWAGFGANLVASSLFVILAGGWYFDMALSAYRLCGIELCNDAGTPTQEDEAWAAESE